MSGKKIKLCVAMVICLSASVSASNSFPRYNNLQILSPHPDDSVLTFGGLLYDLGKDFTINDVHYNVLANISNYVVTGGSPSVEEVTGIRHLEDINAYNKLLMTDDRIKHYTYTAFNEKDSPLINSSDTDFSGFNDAAVAQFKNAYHQIYNLMATVSQQPGTCAFMVNAALPNPGGYGHINHFILREAALKAVHDLGSSKLKCDVYLGEDLPYYNNNKTGAHKMIEALTTRLHLTPVDYVIDVEKKMNAVNQYPSQLTSDYEAAVRARAVELGDKERVYKLDSNYFTNFHVDSSCSKDYCKY